MHFSQVMQDRAPFAYVHSLIVRKLKPLSFARHLVRVVALLR